MNALPAMRRAASDAACSAARRPAAAARLAAAKTALRALARARRSAWTAARTRTAARAIQRAVLRLPEWEAARCVCLYLARPVEADTRRLLAACRRANQRVLVPAFRAAAGAYGLAWLGPRARLAPGRGGVAEPVRPRWAPRAARADLAVVPGLAFDCAGGRLGYGRGHYDRLLAAPTLRGALKVGLAFAGQIVSRVPMGPRDVRLDVIVTETAVFRRLAGRSRLGRRRAAAVTATPRTHRAPRLGRGGRSAP